MLCILERLCLEQTEQSAVRVPLQKLSAPTHFLAEARILSGRWNASGEHSRAFSAGYKLRDREHNELAFRSHFA